MAFKIRDLLITVLPKGLEIFDEGPCDAGSENPPGPPPDPPGPDPGPDSQPSSPRDVRELRAILQLALTELGGPLRPGELGPRNAAELEALEHRLVGALEEVRDLRRKFWV